MTAIGCVASVLAATVKLSRLSNPKSPVLGLLDAWGRLYPSKRLALKTIELIVHDRLTTGGLNDRQGTGVQAPQ